MQAWRQYQALSAGYEGRLGEEKSPSVSGDGTRIPTGPTSNRFDTSEDDTQKVVGTSAPEDGPPSRDPSTLSATTAVETSSGIVDTTAPTSEGTVNTRIAQGPIQSVSPDSEKRDQSAIYVEFEQNDPQHPQNWSHWYKSWVIAQLTFLTLSLTFASAASSPAERGMMEEFGCSEVAATASTGLFLIGMGLGAMPTAPLSEFLGRSPVYIITVFLAVVLGIGCALAPNTPALLILRFLTGLVSSAPLSNAGGTLNDIGTPLSRTVQFPIFTCCGFIAPTVAQLMGGYIVTDPAYGWRWMYWICVIWNSLAFLLVLFFMPETLAPALLNMKAKRLRRVTGSKRWRSKVEDEKFWPALLTALKRPFTMLLVEPVLQFFMLYLTVVYIVLYGSFSSYPLIFSDHGLSQRSLGLAFIPVAIGFLCLVPVSIIHYRRYRGLQRDAKRGIERRVVVEGKVEPEERLVPLMAINIFFPIGLFWLSWTSPSHFNIWIPLLSGLPFAIGLLGIMQGCMMYMIDAYGPFAASALATSTFVRYCVPGLVILAYPRMYQDLGNVWATSLMGFLALALTPLPFVFFIYGRRVRSRCRFTVKG